MKILKTIISLAAAFCSNLFAQGDAELFDTSKNDAEKFVGLLPEQIKTIAVISPGSHPGKPLHKKGIEFLQKAGYKVKIMPNAFVRQKEKAQAPLAGRLADFYQAWNDPEVDMIICVRGGLGSEQVMDHLDWTKLKKRPELYFQGYSDITLITCTLFAKGYGHPVAGPNTGSMAGMTPDSIDAMKKIYHGEQLGPIKLEPLVPGDCKGYPLPGLLQRLSVLTDKEYCPNAKGRIVFIEEVGNSAEMIEKNLNKLLEKNFFKDAAGIVFCHFVRCKDQHKIDGILKAFAPKTGLPVYKGFPFGHTSRIYCIDFARPVSITNGKVTFSAAAR